MQLLDTLPLRYPVWVHIELYTWFTPISRYHHHSSQKHPIPSSHMGPAHSPSHGTSTLTLTWDQHPHPHMGPAHSPSHGTSTLTFTWDQHTHPHMGPAHSPSHSTLTLTWDQHTHPHTAHSPSHGTSTLTLTQHTHPHMGPAHSPSHGTSTLTLTQHTYPWYRSSSLFAFLQESEDTECSLLLQSTECSLSLRPLFLTDAAARKGGQVCKLCMNSSCTQRQYVY